jgi:hypothetical protein
MWDAVTYAREQGLALLLLNGIANFYQRFGFANVTDLCEQHIALTTINSLPRSSYTVRAALPADSEALLGRYRRHHNCFERSRELQEHLQQKHPHWQLAIDPNGQICGYLVLHSKGERANAIEAVADDWQAGLALLHAHAAELPETERPAVLMWPLPLTSTTYYLLADQIELRSIITSIPQAEWMARIGSLAALVQQLLPHWQKRLQQFPVLHPLRLRHVIGDQEYSLAIDGPTIKLVAPQPTDRVVHMDPEVAIKLLFGYRPLRWAMAQPGQIIPTDLLPILERLYPIGPLWVPGSDHF